MDIFIVGMKAFQAVGGGKKLWSCTINHLSSFDFYHVSAHFFCLPTLSRECRFVSCRLRPWFADTSCRVSDMSATRRWSCRCRGDISCRLGGLKDTTFDDMSRHVVNVCNNVIFF